MDLSSEACGVGNPAGGRRLRTRDGPPRENGPGFEDPPMTIAILILLLGALAVGVPHLLLRCAHLDEQGHSALYWQTGPGGQVRGWCPICGRTTRGWRVF